MAKQLLMKTGHTGNYSGELLEWLSVDLLARWLGNLGPFHYTGMTVECQHFIITSW